MDMAAFYNFAFLILVSPMTNVRGVDVTAADKIPLQRRTRATVNSFTDVVSHAFCDSSLQAEEKIAKKSLDEVHTFAELKHDPRAHSRKKAGSRDPGSRTFFGPN